MYIHCLLENILVSLRYNSVLFIENLNAYVSHLALYAFPVSSCLCSFNDTNLVPNDLITDSIIYSVSAEPRVNV